MFQDRINTGIFFDPLIAKNKLLEDWTPKNSYIFLGVKINYRSFDPKNTERANFQPKQIRWTPLPPAPFNSPTQLSNLITPWRHNMVAIHNSVNFPRTSTLFVQSSVVFVLYTHSSTRLTWEENKLHENGGRWLSDCASPCSKIREDCPKMTVYFRYVCTHYRQF